MVDHKSNQEIVISGDFEDSDLTATSRLDSQSLSISEEEKR